MGWGNNNSMFGVSIKAVMKEATAVIEVDLVGRVMMEINRYLFFICIK